MKFTDEQCRKLVANARAFGEKCAFGFSPHPMPLVEALEERLGLEPVLPLRDRALRMFTEAPGGMDGYESALRAIDYVIAELSGPSELAPLLPEEIKDLESFIHGGDLGLYWRCIDATLNSFRPARVARAKR